MKKLSIIALVLVICLAAVGVGYASWTDTITIDGDVQTGSVDLQIRGYSNTWVYKNLTTHELVAGVNELSDPNMLYVASATSVYGGADDTVHMAWDNIFPTCFKFSADAKWEYEGTVPVVVSLVCTPEAGSEWLSPYMTTELKFKHGTAAWANVVQGVTEIYKDDLLMLTIGVRLPQDDTLQGKSASFSCTLTVTQWAECKS